MNTALKKKPLQLVITSFQILLFCGLLTHLTQSSFAKNYNNNTLDSNTLTSQKLLLPSISSLLTDTFTIYSNLPHNIPIYSNKNNNLNTSNLKRTQANNASKLTYSGYKSIVVNSSENIELNQTLQLDIEGELSKNLFIKAHLSDQKIPITSEGYTSTLQEIDQIFIEIYNSNFRLLLGNYLLSFGQKEDEYQENVQGILFKWENKKWKTISHVSQSLGNYHRYSFTGEEGKKENYLLIGKNGESPITLLPQSEKVWKNGHLLERNKDYKIYYGEGKLDLISNEFPSSQDFFTIEFQYTQRTYSHTIIAQHLEQKKGAFKWSIRALSNIDDIHSVDTSVISNSKKDSLIQGGDSVLKTADSSLLPQRHSHITTSFQFKKHHLSIQSHCLMSEQDLNLYSSKQDHNNMGYGCLLSLANQWGNAKQFLKLKLQVEAKDSLYRSLKPIYENYNFLQQWNLLNLFHQNGYQTAHFFIENKLHPLFLWSAEIGTFTGHSDSVLASSSKLKVHNLIGSNATHLSTQTAFSFQKYQNAINTKAVHSQQMTYQATAVWDNSYFFSEIKNTGKYQRYPNQFKPSLDSLSFKTNNNNSTDWKLKVPFVFTQYIQLNHQGKQQFSQIKNPLQDSNQQEWQFGNKLQLTNQKSLDWSLLWNIQNIEQTLITYNLATAPITQINHSTNQLYQTNFTWQKREQGLLLNTQYRLTPKQETPLIQRFTRVSNGTGQYQCDTTVIYFEATCILTSELGGNYNLTGLQRDSVQKKVLDLGWKFTFSYTPIHYSLNSRNFIRINRFNIDFLFSHQDSLFSFFPRLSPTQNKQTIASHFFIKPSVIIDYTKYKQTYSWQGTREFKHSKLLFNQTDLWQQNIHLNWELYSYLIWNLGFISTLQKQKFNTQTNPFSRYNESYSLQSQWKANIDFLWQWIPSIDYTFSKGDDLLLTYKLHSVYTKNKLQYKWKQLGNVSLEYGLYHRFGKGEQSIFNGGGEFTKGTTHRLGFIANLKLKEKLFVNAHYIVRKNPHENKLNQRLISEVKAIF